MKIIDLQWPDKRLSPNDRSHWAARSKVKKAQRHNAAMATAITLGLGAKFPPGPIHVWITFFPPDRRKRDQDNMVAAMKSALDGIADALKVDDARFVLHPHVSDEIGGRVEVVLTTGVL